jgi:hypothetical protein
MEVQMQQRGTMSMDRSYALELAKGPAVTGMLAREPLFCFGKQEQWPGRWVVWCLLSVDARAHMLPITRIARRLLGQQLGTGRHEAVIRSDFKQGHRWAELCGMKWHHHEEMFLPGQQDADIYVRFC